jgi:hypothetical protein
VLLALLPLAGWVFWHRDDLSVRVRRAYWSRRCACYVIPPDLKLIETDPKRIADIAATSDDYVITGHVGRLESAAFYPRCFRDLYLVEPRAWELGAARVAGINGARELSHTAMLGPVAGYPPIVFMHERTSPGGTRRLVIVSGLWTNALDLEKYTDAIAIPVASVFDTLTPQMRTQTMSQYSGAYVQADLHPGIADPADASHFTIPYDAENTPHVLHGYLQDDGTVRFRKE